MYSGQGYHILMGHMRTQYNVDRLQIKSSFQQFLIKK